MKGQRRAWGGLIEFVKRGIICKRIKQFQTVTSESICSEINISKKKWFCMSIHRPPNFSNLDIFFNKFTHSLSKVILTYENFIIMCDFNIDVNTIGVEVNKPDAFCNLLDLTNLIKTQTCCTKSRKSTINLFLTNRPLSFQKTRATETGISDFNKLISNFLKYYYTRLKPKIICYRNYKSLAKSCLLEILKIRTLQLTLTIPTRTMYISPIHFLKTCKRMPQ